MKFKLSGAWLLVFKNIINNFDANYTNWIPTTYSNSFFLFPKENSRAVNSDEEERHSDALRLSVHQPEYIWLNHQSLTGLRKFCHCQYFGVSTKIRINIKKRTYNMIIVTETFGQYFTQPSSSVRITQPSSSVRIIFIQLTKFHEFARVFICLYA